MSSEREGTVPAPSDEAKRAASDAAWLALPGGARRMCDGSRPAAAALTAAYAIDLPRREAEVRAEERAATLRALESNEALNVAAAAFENRVGTTYGVGDGLRAALSAVAAHFNPEAE